MKLNKKNIFLFDGIGAFLSFVSTGLILPIFSDWVGMQKEFLYFLAVFPLLFCLFSFTCYRLVNEIKRWMLSTIIIANLLYCLVSILTVFVYDGITLWGQAFLIGEILLVMCVVGIEIKIHRKFQSPS